MAALLYKWTVLFLFPFGTSLAEHSPAAVTRHPFYISVTEMNHNAKDKTLEISCKLFAEDMEDVLKQNYKVPVDLSADKNKAQNDKLVNTYLINHLQVVTDGKPARLSFIGFEKEAESVYCYFEIQNVATLKKIDITDSILQDFNNTEINIIHVIVNGRRQSTKLNYPDKQAAFTF